MIGDFPIGAFAAAFVALLLPNGAVAEPPADVGSCAAPAALSVIDVPLERTTLRIEQAQPLTIVAMGSSSTQALARAPRR